MIATRRLRETPRELEHRCDREVIAAVWKREKAKAGQGATFELPPSLREKA
jgi:hypothetical protein